MNVQPALKSNGNESFESPGALIAEHRANQARQLSEILFKGVGASACFQRCRAQVLIDGTHASTFGNVHDVSSFTLCGHTVVLTSNERNSTALLRLEVDGTRLTQLATGNLWSPTCSPDSRFVYYVNLEQPEKVWRMPLEGGTAVEVGRVLGDSIMGNITVSPDGKFIAYPYSAYTGTAQGRHLAIMPAVGGRPLALFDLPGDSWTVGPFWNSNGKALQFVQVRDGVSNIWEQSLDGGPPRQLTRFTSGQIFDFAWSGDRKQLFVTRGSVSSDAVILTGLP